MKILLLTYYSLGTAYHALDLFLHFSLPCFHPPLPLFSSLHPLPPLVLDKCIRGAPEKVGLDNITCEEFFLSKNFLVRFLDF